ncbi:MAG: PhnD/SsuA/transferrin family substrate-binding protein [Pirellulales bacterium]
MTNATRINRRGLRTRIGSLVLPAVLAAATFAQSPVASGADVADKAVAHGAALVMVVMDPLAKPLSCPCVQGYAQRDYDKLAAVLEKSLGRKVVVVYSDSLKAALKRKESGGAADIVIGKQSVVLADAAAVEVSLAKIAMLTGKDGATTQTGLVVVAKDDPAKTVADLTGYPMYFGPEECDEKHAAALALLKKHGVEPPQSIETAAACDEGAIKILDLAKDGKPGAAVISSYAKPLLEGCGQVEKGSLRVIGETEPVPFVAAFVNEKLDDAMRAAVAKAVLESTSDLTLRIALETKNGFVAEAKAAGPATAVQRVRGRAERREERRGAAAEGAKKK